MHDSHPPARRRSDERFMQVFGIVAVIFLGTFIATASSAQPAVVLSIAPAGSSVRIRGYFLDAPDEE